MKKFMGSLMLLGLLIGGFNSWGLVSLQNGNYYLEMEPVEMPKVTGYEFNLVVAYNSRSQFTGLFGYGFGTQYETKLQAMPDGSVLITDYGGADGFRYAPKNDNVAAIKEAVAKVLKAAGKTGDKVLETKLMESVEERAVWFARYQVQAAIAVGTQLYNSARPLETVTKLKQAFQRKFQASGREEFYDDYGRLYQIRDRGGNFIQIGYDKKTGRIAYLKDKANRTIFFKTNENGRVVECWTSVNSKTRSTFEYDDKQRLVKHKDVYNERVAFAYDIVGNITKVAWLNDNSSENIEYNATRDFVTKVTDRNNMETIYRQEKNASDPNGYIKQTVMVKPPKGEAEQRVYEFWFKNKTTGERYKYKQRVVVGGEVVTTVFNECCGKPVEEVSSTKGKSTYEYNQAGLLTRQVFPDGASKSYTYHPTLGKVASVAETIKNATGKVVTSWVKVAYDEKSGNINNVANSDGQTLRLAYDQGNRISRILDGKKNEITFRYNNQGRPVQILQKGVGQVTIAYDSSGNVKGADSPQGRVVAMRVSQLMQNLLSIVRPVGISIGP